MANNSDTPKDETKRDFLALTAASFGAVGVAGVAWPFVDTMNPAKDTLALSSIEVDLSPIPKGQAITVMWRGKPVFIRHRTEDEIAQAKNVDLAALPDSQSDEERSEGRGAQGPLSTSRSRRSARAR